MAMEAIFAPSSSPDKSASPYRGFKNPKKNTRPFISKSFSENLAPTRIHGDGLLHTPPPSLSFSHDPYGYRHFHHQQPPLLPLPIPNPHNSRRGPASSPTSRKPGGKTRDQSLTPRKSKPTKREEPTKQSSKPATVIKASEEISKYFIVASANPEGPDPKDLPMDVSRVLCSSSAGNDLEKFSGSVFTLSPPPSSLPLPKFSLRPKLSCNAEAAAGIDAGATDNLRRLLRLR